MSCSCGDRDCICEENCTCHAVRCICMTCRSIREDQCKKCELLNKSNLNQTKDKNRCQCYKPEIRAKSSQSEGSINTTKGRIETYGKSKVHKSRKEATKHLQSASHCLLRNRDSSSSGDDYLDSSKQRHSSKISINSLKQSFLKLTCRVKSSMSGEGHRYKSLSTKSSTEVTQGSSDETDLLTDSSNEIAVSPAKDLSNISEECPPLCTSSPSRKPLPSYGTFSPVGRSKPSSFSQTYRQKRTPSIISKQVNRNLERTAVTPSTNSAVKSKTGTSYEISKTKPVRLAASNKLNSRPYSSSEALSFKYFPSRHTPKSLSTMKIQTESSPLISKRIPDNFRPSVINKSSTPDASYRKYLREPIKSFDDKEHDPRVCSCKEFSSSQTFFTYPRTPGQLSPMKLRAKRKSLTSRHIAQNIRPVIITKSSSNRLKDETGSVPKPIKFGRS